MNFSRSIRDLCVPFLCCGVSLVLFCGDSPAVGQAIQVSAKAGIASTTFTGDPDTDFDAKPAFVGGFVLARPVNRNLHFAPEILYTTKGAETVATIDNVPLELNFSVIYLNVPLLAKYIVSPGGKVSPILTAGPVVSWNIDSRVLFNAVGSDTRFNETDDSIKTLDYGAAVGAGVELAWDLRRIAIEFRYTRGVSNIIDNDDDPKHNSVFSLTAGVGL